MEPSCPAHPAPSIHPWGGGTLGVDEALPSHLPLLAHHCPNTYQEPLGTPLGLAQRKRASPRGEAGTSGFLCVSDSDRI